MVRVLAHHLNRITKIGLLVGSVANNDDVLVAGEDCRFTAYAAVV
jgi:hypothetical protein